MQEHRRIHVARRGEETSGKENPIAVGGSGPGEFRSEQIGEEAMIASHAPSLLRSCIPCEFHEEKMEQDRPVSSCRKENCWSQFSKCVAKEALRRFLESESVAQSLLAGAESPERPGFLDPGQTETP